jgi:hypothetical protein
LRKFHETLARELYSGGRGNFSIFAKSGFVKYTGFWPPVGQNGSVDTSWKVPIFETFPCDYSMMLIET